MTAGTLYNWRVRANCTGATGNYTAAQFTTTSPCPGPYDVSTNGTYTGAALIPLNNDIKGTISASSDIDYFKFTITTAGTATINLTTLPANYNLTLYSTNGTTSLKTSTNPGTTNDSISNYSFGMGTYYIKVSPSGSAANASSCYTLRVKTVTAAGAALQPGQNDPSLGAPSSIENSVALSVKIYPNPSKEKVTVYLIGDNTQKMLSIHDLAGRMVYQGPLAEVFTTLDVTNLANGIYIFSVHAQNGQLLHNERFMKN